MTEKEKVISLYNYISEVSKNSKSICKNISKEVWFYFLEALPKDDNIIVNNFNDEENDIILEIRKPNLLKPLEIEKNLLPWLEGNWDNYN